MAPNGGWLVYQVQVKAVRKGDARFEVNCIADQIKKPVVDQESTQCFDPNTGASDGAMILPKNDGEDVLIPAADQRVPVPVKEELEPKVEPKEDLPVLELPPITIEKST